MPRGSQGNFPLYEWDGCEFLSTPEGVRPPGDILGWEEFVISGSYRSDRLLTPVASNRPPNKSSLLVGRLSRSLVPSLFIQQFYGVVQICWTEYIFPLYCTGCTVLGWAKHSPRRVPWTQCGTWMFILLWILLLWILVVCWNSKILLNIWRFFVECSQ